MTELEGLYAGYEIRDQRGERIGKVDDVFVNEDDKPEYIGVKIGFFGTRTALIPLEVVAVDERRRLVEVPQLKRRIKHGPAFDDDQEITPEYEERVRRSYDLPEDRANRDVNRERGGFRQHPSGDEDEVRIARSEEELRVGTCEREAGGVNVRKRVRHDRERARIPRMREEVTVERIPVDEDRVAPEAEIGEAELFVPVVEDEVVVEKRPVVKEEVRLRKKVVRDVETVEEDVRKEEIDIDDQTGYH